MANLVNPDLFRLAERIPPVASLLAASIALAAIAGWICDVEMLKSLSRSFVSMKANAALGILFCAISLWLQPRGPSRRIAKGLLVVPLALSLMTLLEYAAGTNFRIDELLFKESPLALASEFPGRMAKSTAVTLLLTAIGLLFLRVDLPNGKSVWPWFALSALSLSVLNLIGYAYGVEGALGFGTQSRMGLNTAIAFASLGTGIIFSRLDRDFTMILVSDGPGALLIRRLLPFALVGPALLGWLRLQGESAELFSPQFGTAAFACMIIVSFAAMTWWTAMRVQRSSIEHGQVDTERNRLRIEAELREQFVSMLSHDLRNPLSAAKVSAELLSRGELSAEKAKSLIRIITDAAGRADQMVQDLLDVTRVRAGHELALKFEECDLSSLVGATVEEMTFVHGNRFRMHRDENLRARCDCKAVRRALENLLKNAVKYGQPEAPITIRLNSRNGWVYLSVQNLGPVIPVEIQRELFTPFRRASDAVSAGKRGWGIGLALVKGIAEGHSGEVQVESGPQGTIFTMKLPHLAGPAEKLG